MDKSHTNFLISFRRYCAPPPRALVIKVCLRPVEVYTVLQMGRQTAIGLPCFIPKDQPFGTQGTDQRALLLPGGQKP